LNPLARAAVALVAAALLAPAGRAAAPPDPADLFPADALAFAELHDPAAVAPDLAAAFKGTPLEDSLAFVHARRDKATKPLDLTGKQELAVLGLLASPEMAAEVRKLRGVAVGLTGFTPRGEPEGALAVLTGDSAAFGLAARAFLTMTHVRKVGAAGDVPVYQFRQPGFTYDQNTGQQKLANEKPPTEGAYEATFAYVPGLFVVGTSRPAVAGVLARFQGKAKGTLAANAAFQAAAAAHRKPGVFYFANVPELAAKYDAARKAGGAGDEPDAYGWFKLVANAKAVRSLAGSVRFRDGGLAATAAGVFDPAAKSPLLDFLSGPGVKVEYLRNAPYGAALAATVALPEKDRAAAVIAFLDAVAKADGGLGRLPGEAVKELDAKYRLAIADDLVGKTRAVTVVVPARQELPKGAVPLPMLVLHTAGPDAAAAWAAFLPKLVGDLSGGDPPAPSSEMVGAVQVLSLAGTGLPWRAAVHYAHKDGLFVVGLDRKLVGAAVAGGATPAGLPADAPALFGTVAAGVVFRTTAVTPKPDGPVVPITPVGPAGGPRPNSEEVVPGQAQKNEEAKAWAALEKALDGLPVATLSGRRAGDELRVEVWQPKVQAGGLAAVVAAGVGWLDTLLDLHGDPNGNPRFGRFR